MAFYRYNTNVFSSKRERTYEILLQDMVDTYSDAADSTQANSTAATSPSGSATLVGGYPFRKREVDSKMVRELDGPLIDFNRQTWWYRVIDYMTHYETKCSAGTRTSAKKDH